MTLSLRSGPVQLELVPAPITLAAEFSKVLDVPHSLPLPPRMVVQSSSRGNINIIANSKSHSNPVLSSQRVRQPNIVQLKENYSYKAIAILTSWHHKQLLGVSKRANRLATVLLKENCASSGYFGVRLHFLKILVAALEYEANEALFLCTTLAMT